MLRYLLVLFLLQRAVNLVLCRTHAKVAVVCFQKDDFELIEYWIRYHTELFGFEDVAVLDNFSQNVSLVSRLDYWRSKGVRVMYKQGPYAKKGPVTAAAFQKLFPNHDIALALDADEFLVSYRNGVPIVNGTMIRSDMDAFWATPYYCAGLRQYYANYITDNSSVETSEYVNNGPVYPVDGCKHFAKLKNLVYLDHGNHQIHVRTKSGKLRTQESCQHELNRLGLLHYQNTSPYQALRKAISDCVGFRHLPANVTVENLLLFPDVMQRLQRDLLDANKTIYGRHKAHRVVQSYHKMLNLAKETEAKGAETKGTGVPNTTQHVTQHIHTAPSGVGSHNNRGVPSNLHRVGSLEEMIRQLSATPFYANYHGESESTGSAEYTDYYIEPWYLRVYAYFMGSS